MNTDCEKSATALIGRRFRRRGAALALVLGTGIGAFPSRASVTTLEFNNGNGAASVDQYVGTSGGGWLSAWSSSNAATMNGTVTNASPLVTGGGNYLSITANGTGEKAIRRQFDGSVSGQDVTQPYQIKFNIRIDSRTGWDAASDVISIMDRSTAGSATSTTSAFIIRVYGATPGASKPANQWLLYNGAKDDGAFDVNKLVDSGMAVAVGTTYQFTINLNPANRDYTVSIYDGVNTVNSSAMGFRTSAFSGREHLHFHNIQSAAQDSTVFSIDRIEVIPEPAAAGMIGLGALSLWLRRRTLRRLGA